MSETPTPLTLEQIAGGIRHRMGQQPSAQYIFVPRDWLEIVLSALQDVRAEATSHPCVHWRENRARVLALVDSLPVKRDGLGGDTVSKGDLVRALENLFASTQRAAV
jgi:hypothetical protein